MITKRQMGLAAPTAAKTGRIDLWYDALIAAMIKHQITTPNRIDYFLANVMEETGELQAREENLHYSADQLRRVFPSIFDSLANADQVAAGGSEMVGNVIYGDAYRSPGYRMGNKAPGDGYKYRGRGPMQLTGRNNYEAFFRACGLPIDSDPDLLLQPIMGAESAAHFWEVAGCNASADKGAFTEAVIKVNGGTINLQTREMYLGRFVDAMNHPDPVETPKPVEIPAPVPEPAVTMDELKPKPALEPVPTPGPVPPPGFETKESGNVVLSDIKQSGIVKGANVGQVVTGAAGAVTVTAGAASQVKGLLPDHLSDVATICLTVVVLALLGVVFWYFRSVKRQRIDLNKRGIA